MMSEKLNIGQSTYSRIETQALEKESNILLKICDVLCCTPYELIFPDLFIEKLTDEEKKVLMLYKKLPGRMKLIIKELMKEYLRRGY